MFTTELEKLKQLAKAATQGDWWIDSHGHAMVSFHRGGDMSTIFITDSKQMGPARRHEDTGNLSHWGNDNDATFIASFNPQKAIKLIEALEKERETSAFLRQKIRELQGAGDEEA